MRFKQKNLIIKFKKSPTRSLKNHIFALLNTSGKKNYKKLVIEKKRFYLQKEDLN